MIGRWWRARRRRKLRARGLPPQTTEILQRNVHQVSWLNDAARARLFNWLPVFLGEKYWSGIRDFDITMEMKLTVAAQVGIVLLGFEDEYLDRLQSIILSPQLLREDRRDSRSGILFEESPALGEAYPGGPVRLAWPSVLQGGWHPGDGQNVVYHEIAHVLDMHDGFTDGLPPLASAELTREWQRVLKQEYSALVANSRLGHHGVIDPYGAVNPGEFFAVSTEAFFETPRALAHQHPDWYDLLCTFYRQDPRTWMPN